MEPPAPFGAMTGAVSSPLPAGAKQAGADGGKRIESAAHDFEALMISELLRAARLDGSAGWLQDEDSAADSAFGLAQEQFARALSGGLGIARLVLDNLGSARAGAAPSPPAERPADAP